MNMMYCHQSFSPLRSIKQSNLDVRHLSFQHCIQKRSLSYPGWSVSPSYIVLLSKVTHGYQLLPDNCTFVCQAETDECQKLQKNEVPTLFSFL